MRFLNVGYAILAPTVASALAMPEQTHYFAVAADNWSPAPTAAPQINILGRQALQADENNTCGYVSGLSASPISCSNSKQICATNTYFGVHGCCDPSNLSACTIATTCIPSSAMSSLCKDSSCTSNGAIAKCTASTAAECYKWLFAYDSTTMTQHGCTDSGFTSTAQRSFGPLTSSRTATDSASKSPMESPTSSSTSSSSSTPNEGGNEKKQSLGPIIGGTVGGCTILSLVALSAILIHRRRRRTSLSSSPSSSPPNQPHGTPEFDPTAYSTTTWSHETKTWQTGPGGGDGPGPYLGIAEVHGQDRAVEVEAPEKSKRGSWRSPGVAPVEVDGTPTPAVAVKEEGEKKRWWRGPVEAPT